MFITNQPAMKIKEYLVISDLHLGITRDLWQSGVSLPSQVKTLSERLNKLKKSTGAKKLIILGDVKHKVPGISFQETREIPEFLAALNFKKIIITKGNHDGDIEKIIPLKLKLKVSVKKSFTVGDYYFTHGHANANTSKRIIVIGHNQPHIKFRDDVGALYTEPAWVRGPLKESKRKLIIVPAFNELCGATVINQDELLGPIAKQLDRNKAHVYLLDGTDLGILADLKLKEKISRKRKRRK
jgi:hypothetical protein